MGHIKESELAAFKAKLHQLAKGDKCTQRAKMYCLHLAGSVDMLHAVLSADHMHPSDRDKADVTFDTENCWGRSF